MKKDSLWRCNPALLDMRKLPCISNVSWTTVNWQRKTNKQTKNSKQINSHSFPIEDVIKEISGEFSKLEFLYPSLQTSNNSTMLHQAKETGRERSHSLSSLAPVRPKHCCGGGWESCILPLGQEVPVNISEMFCFSIL